MRNPTQSDVARAVGVSRGLVSLALSGSPLVAQDTRERILKAADELGYTRDLGASALAAGRSPFVGVVLPDLRNPFFEEVVDTLQTEAEERGLLALVATAADDRAREAVALHRFRELRASGVVIVSPVQPSASLEAAGRNQPLVLIGAAGRGDNFDTVHIDEDVAARLIVGHVLDRGWESILALSLRTASDEVWVSKRAEALGRAAEEAGVPVTRLVADGDTGISRVLRSGLQDVRRSRTAIVAHNDLVGMYALMAVQAMGLAPGRDVAIIGFDDTHVAAHPEFGFTSVAQDCRSLARISLRSLVERGGAGDGSPPREGSEHVVGTTLSVRGTS